MAITSINIFGVKGAKLLLAKELVQTKANVAEGLNRAALHMQSQVKRSIAGREAEPTSVDTGRLLNSVEFEVTDKNASVFTFVPYGIKIEDGTSRFRGRHHFRNSLNRNRLEIQRILNLLGEH